MSVVTLSNAPSAQEINVTFEDQQKINRFARLNSKREEVKEELKQKQLEVQNVDDALNEIQAAELEADDGEDGVQVMEGEIFVHFAWDKATSWIEDKKKRAEEEAAVLNQTIDSIREEMDQLKTTLYAKFGRENINLEADE